MFWFVRLHTWVSRRVLAAVRSLVGAQMDALHRHRSLYKGTTPPWKETYRKVRLNTHLPVSWLAALAYQVEANCYVFRLNSVLSSVCLCSAALCGQAEKQPVQAAGEIPSDGGEPAAQWPRGLHHRPGGDGGGVDRPAVGGPETALFMGATGHGRGRSVARSHLSPSSLLSFRNS